jgi:AP2-associated kinase
MADTVQIYTGRTASEARKNQALPSPPGQVSSPPIIGASKVAAPVEEKVHIPDITPMRRGRPTSTQLGAANQKSSQPSPSPRRGVGGDPFAALDSNGAAPATSPTFDDASSRFPSLDQFSLLHESGNKFDFDSNVPISQQPPLTQPRGISLRVTEALADEAFASLSSPPPQDTPQHAKSVPNTFSRNSSAAQSAFRPPSPPKAQAQIKPRMVSTGVQTGDRSSPPEAAPSPRPIFRFPTQEQRSSGQPRPPGSPQLTSKKSDNLLPARPTLLDHRSKSQVLTATKSATQPRQSTDGPRPLPDDLAAPMARSRSTNQRSRPVSTHLENAANFIKGRSSSRGKDDQPDLLVKDLTGKQEEPDRIDSNVDFLKAMEEEEASKRKEKRLSSSGSRHSKRASMPSVSLSGTKNLLAGRFGEAFRRFETNEPAVEEGFPDSTGLTPIAGSEATDGRSDDGQVLEETEEMSPEMRRELERRRLSQEERRVAEAGAAYKQGLGGPPARKDSSRAASIQNKVQALLDQSSQPSPTKTAEGYGRFTNSPAPTGQQGPGSLPPEVASNTPRQAEMPIRATSQTNTGFAPTEPRSAGRSPAPPKPQPKPQALRTGGNNPPVAPKPGNLSRPSTRTPLQQQQQQQAPDRDAEDWEANFSKKYPSLAGLEMVETQITGNVGNKGGMRDI